VFLGALVCFAWLPQARAQADAELPHLLFEPVTLDVIRNEGDVAAADAPSYTARELSTLAQGPAIDLQQWLRENRAAPAALAADDIAADIAAYEQAVLDMESKGGAFDARLDQELLSLGALLQQAGDYTRAQASFDRALHINRVNSGLFSMNQIPIIESMIENHLARGDLVAADEQQEYLLYVQRKNHGDRAVDLLPALTRYAEWNLFAFRARLTPPPPALVDTEGEPPPAPKLEENSDMMLSFRIGRLINAHNVYQSLISIVTSNFGPGDSRLRTFEQQLALTNYLYITTFGLQTDPMLMQTNSMVPFDNGEVARPPMGFRQGRDSLERRIAFLENEPDASARQTAQARLDLADWMLMFSKRTGSLEIYLEAWQDMVEAGATQEELGALFNPDFPQEIPSYLEHPYSRASIGLPADVALEYKGYIDVEFKLSRYGVASSISVLGRSPTATPELEARLLRNIRRAGYRPRIADGALRDEEQIYTRFYYTY
jgi:tetratricopeptide (TPR) repeat protein